MGAQPTRSKDPCGGEDNERPCYCRVGRSSFALSWPISAYLWYREGGWQTECQSCRYAASATTVPQIGPNVMAYLSSVGPSQNGCWVAELENALMATELKLQLFCCLAAENAASHVEANCRRRFVETLGHEMRKSVPLAHDVRDWVAASKIV